MNRPPKNAQPLRPEQPLNPLIMQQLLQAKALENQRRYPEAIAAYEAGLTLATRFYGKNLAHSDIAASLNNLGSVHKALGNPQEALAYFKQALEMEYHVFGRYANHEAIAISLNNLGSVLDSLGNPQEALAYHEQALEMRYHVFGRYANHEAIAISLNNLGSVLDSLGNPQEALAYHKKALEMQYHVFGRYANHKDIATSLNNLGLTHWRIALQEADKARCVEALQQAWENIGASFDSGYCLALTLYGALSEASWEQYQGQSLFRERYESLVNLGVRYFAGDSAAVQRLYDRWLQRKLLEVDLRREQSQKILSGRYPEQLPRLEKLTALRRQLALILGEPDTLRTEGPRLRGEIAHLERALGRVIPEIARELENQQITHAKVAQSLPAGNTLIEFVRYDAFDVTTTEQWGAACYAAFVVAGNGADMRLVDLGEAAPIDEAIAHYLRMAPPPSDGRGTGAHPPPSSPSAEESVEGLRGLLRGLDLPEGIKHLWIAPDGELAFFPFVLLWPGTPLSYLPSGRALPEAVAPRPTIAATDALVIADPAYRLGKAPVRPPLAIERSGVVGRTRRAGSPAPKIGPDAATFASLWGGKRGIDRTGFDYKRLPGTRLEAQALQAHHGFVPVMDGAALYSRLISCVSPWLLHLATHGFLLADEETTPQSLTGGGSPRAHATGENPLNRSGVALAGVLEYWRGDTLPPEAHPGLATATQILGMNLRGTQMVVLSVCGSGRGEAKAGRGVMGLRSAFAEAGAQTLIMTLWAVEDLPTAILMEHFYHQLLVEKRRVDEALAAAQRYLETVTVGELRNTWFGPATIETLEGIQADPRNSADDKKAIASMIAQINRLSSARNHYQPYSHKGYWAGFICQGNLAPLVPPAA